MHDLGPRLVESLNPESASHAEVLTEEDREQRRGASGFVDTLEVLTAGNLMDVEQEMEEECMPSDQRHNES